MSDAHAADSQPHGADRAPLLEGPGSSIGPYRLLQQLGEGGFGVVFLAEQKEPVARQVALKIIKLGMDTRQVVARFEQERQALALMDHPNIARVIDAGATATGRPYFVMELVKGVPIGEYCDRNSLTIAERLELFVQVCGAVQHAHQKGIIHRDLKPSNLLVAVQDSLPQVKVIDFGIAKATSAKLTEKTLYTEQQQVIGTLQYMSPEQAEGSLDVDTRADVYALGVVLYELLTGTTPFDPRTLRDGIYSEIQRMIREVEPPSPSTRLSASRDTLAGIAARRSVEPERLGKLLRGELDWIVMKALEKDRARRYASASEFALDVERYLGGEAVLAAPPSAAYRLRKFVARHRVPVVAGAAVALALVAGVLAFAWQARIAGEQRDLVIKAEGELRARAEELQRVSDFQSGMLAQIDTTIAGQNLSADVERRLAAALAKAGVPEAESAAQQKTFLELWSRVNAVDAARELIDRTILRPAIATIDTDFQDQPLVDAQLRQVLADRYQGLGLFAEALPLQLRALETRRKLLGGEDRRTLVSLNAQAELLTNLGRLAEAEAQAREALETRRRSFGADDPDTFDSLYTWSVIEVSQGRFQEGEQAAREELAGRLRVQGARHERTIAAEAQLASALRQEERWEEAEQCYRSALARSRSAFGDEHRSTINLLNGLGTLLQERGRLEDAATVFRELVAASRRTFGEEHPSTLLPLGNLGFVLLSQGKLDEAEPLLQESLDKRRRVFGPDNPVTLYSLNDLGELRRAQGRIYEAAKALREVLAKRRQTLGEAHELVLRTTRSLVDALDRMEEHEEAVRLLRGRVEALHAALGDAHEFTLATRALLGVVLLHAHELDECERELRAVLALAPKALGEAHETTLEAEDALCDLLIGTGRRAEGEELARRSLQTRRRLLGADDLHSLTALEMLAVCLQLQGQESEAEPLLKAVLEARTRLQKPEAPQLLATQRNLVVVLLDTGKLGEAETLLRTLLQTSRRVHGTEDPLTLEVLRQLGVLLYQRERWGEAEALLREHLQAVRRVYGAGHPETLLATANLGATLLAQGHHAEALELVGPIVSPLREALGEANPACVAEALLTVGRSRGLGAHTPAEFAAAEAELLEAHALRSAQHAQDPKSPEGDASSLVELYVAWDKAEPGHGHDAQAAQWKAKAASK